jgi:toxin-antitoxin system PIN domain toxin
LEVCIVIDLPDVNVWFPLVQPQHVNHGRSLRYWTEEASPKVAFCQITAHGLLRALSNQKALASEALTVQEAWQQYQSLRALQEVIYASETTAADSFLKQWIDKAAFTPRMWTDAQLAALTKAYEFRFVTFDRDFRRFPGLNVLLLEQEPMPPTGTRS